MNNTSNKSQVPVTNNLYKPKFNDRRPKNNENSGANRNYTAYKGDRVKNNRSTRFSSHPQRYSIRRFWARVIDSLVVYLLFLIAGTIIDIQLPASFGAFILVYTLYQAMFSLSLQPSIGRSAVGIEFIFKANSSYWTKCLNLIKRELLFLILFWAIALELIFSQKAFVHDRWSNVKLTLKS